MPTRLDASDFKSIQAAIDALPAVGGVVYIPAGTYLVTQTIVVPIGKRVHLLGDGRERTIIECDLPNVDIIWIKGSGSILQDLTVKGPYLAPTSNGRGVVIGVLAADSPTEVVRDVAILGCRITETASWALYLIGVDEPGAHSTFSVSLDGRFENTEFSLNKTAGLVTVRQGDFGQSFRNCLFDHFGGVALEAFNTSSLKCEICTFEDKKDNITSYVILDGVDNAVLDTCWFEQHDESDTGKPFIYVGLSTRCRDVCVANCRFVRNSGDLPRVIRVDSASKAVSVMGPVAHLVGPPMGFSSREALPASDKDIAIAGDSEVYISGGVLTSDDIDFAEPALVVAPSTGIVIAGLGPRTTPPKISTTQRDLASSLGRNKKQGDLIFNSDLGGLQSWTGAEWLPAKIGPLSASASQSGTLTAALGTFHVSAIVKLSGSAVGSVAVQVHWFDDGVSQPPLTVVPAFSTAGSVTSAVAFVVAGSSVTYNVISTLTAGTYSVELRAEAV